MGDRGWNPYVSVAERREEADKAVRKAKKAGKDFAPVVLASRSIARTFWGKAWCDHLEAWSDYENRLPRGRSYVRNGAVVDLKVEPGRIVAQVMGSRLYRVEIGIAALAPAKWKKLVGACTGAIATLVELLQGRFSKAVMARLCEAKAGLFPSPRDIRLDCSCPDRATLCKHVAAVLYGVGARLDERPELLFVLRQVDASDLLRAQAAALPARMKKPAKAKVLDDAALAEVFGIEMAEAAPPVGKTPGKPRAAAALPKAAKATKAKPKKSISSPARSAERSIAKSAPTVGATKETVKKKPAASKPGSVAS